MELREKTQWRSEFPSQGPQLKNCIPWMVQQGKNPPAIQDTLV